MLGCFCDVVFIVFRVKLGELVPQAARETQATGYVTEYTLTLLIQAMLWSIYVLILMVCRVPMVTLEMLVSVVYLDLMARRYMASLAV